MKGKRGCHLFSRHRDWHLVWTCRLEKMRPCLLDVLPMIYIYPCHCMSDHLWFPFVPNPHKNKLTSINKIFFSIIIKEIWILGYKRYDQNMFLNIVVFLKNKKLWQKQIIERIFHNYNKRNLNIDIVVFLFDTLIIKYFSLFSTLPNFILYVRK